MKRTTGGNFAIIFFFVWCLLPIVANKGFATEDLNKNDTKSVDLDNSKNKARGFLRTPISYINEKNKFLSPNKKLIAYLAKDKNNKSLGTIKISDTKGKIIEEKIILPIQTKLVTGIRKIEWWNNNTIGYELNISPSTAEYRLLFLSDPKSENSFLGSKFIWNDKYNVLIYRGWIPHFAPKERKSDYLKIDNERIYPLKEDNQNHKFLLGPVLSPNKKFTALFEKYEDKYYFVVFKLIIDNSKKISRKKYIKEISNINDLEVPEILWEENKAILMLKTRKEILLN